MCDKEIIEQKWNFTIDLLKEYGVKPDEGRKWQSLQENFPNCIIIYTMSGGNCFIINLDMTEEEIIFYIQKKLGITKEQKRIKQFIEEFKAEEIVKKNLYDYTWLSGSSTTVYPITIWKNEIEIQWKNDRKCNRFINRIVEKYNDIFKSGYFWKTDGSCPSHIVFTFTNEYKAR